MEGWGQAQLESLAGEPPLRAAAFLFLAPSSPTGLDEGPRQPLRGLARSLGAPGRSLEGGPVT